MLSGMIDRSGSIDLEAINALEAKVEVKPIINKLFLFKKCARTIQAPGNR
jgi:hypothetical protein